MSCESKEIIVMGDRLPTPPWSRPCVYLGRDITICLASIELNLFHLLIIIFFLNFTLLLRP